MRTLATWSLVLVAFVFGCTGGEGDTPSGGSPEKPTETPSGGSLEKATETPSSASSDNAAVTKATRQLGDAVTAVKAVAREKVEQFQTTMEKKLATINQQIEELKTRADEAATAGKEQFKQQVQALAEKRDALQKKLGALGSTTADAWEDMKTGLEAAFQDLEKAVGDAAAQFDEAKTSESSGGGKQG